VVLKTLDLVPFQDKPGLGCEVLDVERSNLMRWNRMVKGVERVDLSRILETENNKRVERKRWFHPHSAKTEARG